jgi:hypothetical protein
MLHYDGTTAYFSGSEAPREEFASFALTELLVSLRHALN